MKLLTGLVALLALSSRVPAQEPVLFAVSPLVGDTIDAAERDSFRLFPGIARFNQAVFLATPDSAFYARVSLGRPDSLGHVYFRFTRIELDRIRFLIENRDLMTGQLASDQNAVAAYTSFWDMALSAPIDTIGGRPATLTFTHTGEGEVTRLPNTVTAENRYRWTLHGATCGSVVGGCLGAYAGYTWLEPGYYEQTECGTTYVPPLYRVNFPALFATTIGVTAAGAAAGYAFGESEDHKPVPARPAGEGQGWRKGCVGGCLLPAVALGFLAADAAQSTLYGREQNGYRVENDPNELSLIPPVLTGLCVTVELVTLSYQIGRSIDRDNAQKAEARRRALGR